MSRPVLIADDDVLLVRTLADILESDGWSVVTAYDGAQAVEAARGHELEAVVIDERMPGADGLEALVEITRDQPAARVFLMSGYPATHILDKAAQVGVLRVLDRTSLAEDLGWEVSAVVRTGRAVLVLDDDSVRIDDLVGRVRESGLAAERAESFTDALALVPGDGPGLVALAASPAEMGAAEAVGLLLETLPALTFAVGSPASAAEWNPVLDPPWSARLLVKPIAPEGLLRLLAGPR